MPIRINLLAEQLAEEELRRRDPVKRALMGFAFVAFLMVGWGGYLQLRLYRERSQVASVEAQFKQIEVQYKLVRTNQNIVADCDRKLLALRQLATNRFLWGPQLNALQYCIVPDVQVARLATLQEFSITEGTKAVTNNATVTKGKPSSALEKVRLTFEARDYSLQPGGQISSFQNSISSNAFFGTRLKKIELTERSIPQADPANPGRNYVQFTIDCQYPERSR